MREVRPELDIRHVVLTDEAVDVVKLEVTPVAELEELLDVVVAVWAELVVVVVEDAVF